MHQPESYALRCRLTIVMLILLSGCRGSEDVSFTFRDAVGELPDTHQQQLKKILVDYYGTATKPQLKTPDPDAEVGEDGTLPLLEVVDPDRLRRGQIVFNKYCAHCHGVTGDGMGPAAGVITADGERIDYLDPRPRDYRLGKFKFTSTPRGYKPRRSDLARIIRYGAKGTSMPAFRWLADEDVEPLIDYVILLSQRGELEKLLIDEAEFELEEEDDFDPEYVAEYVTDIQSSWAEAADNVVLPVTRRPPYTDDSILAGRQIYLDRACAKCHGQDGRGNRTEDVGKDDWGQTAFAADLTAGMLHGGRRPVDIYRRIFAGINGTPMPAFGDALAEQPETMWHLVHYIMSIVENREVEGLDELQPSPTDDPSVETNDGSGTGGDVDDGSGTPDETTDDDSADEVSDDTTPESDEGFTDLDSAEQDTTEQDTTEQDTDEQDTDEQDTDDATAAESDDVDEPVEGDEDDSTVSDAVDSDTADEAGEGDAADSTDEE